MKSYCGRHRWVWAYALLLTIFTTYVLLDTFVITRVYAVAPSAEPTVTATGNTATTENTTENGADGSAVDQKQTSSATITETSYSDGIITIAITEYREYDTSIYVADIKIASAAYLKTAFAQGLFGKNVTEKTSDIAQSNNAILAINGDYYGAQEAGYVVRNSVLFRESRVVGNVDLVIWEDGSFGIVEEENASASDLVAQGAIHVLSFGPALVEGGTVSVDEDDEVGKAKASNPRTAVGIIDDLHYVFVVSDGRTDESEGLTLLELAEFMEALGVETAYNLDGGGSSTMYFNGKIINNPTTSGNSTKERSVSDIVYIGY